MSNIDNIKNEFEKHSRENAAFEYKLNDGLTLSVYPDSLHEFEGGVLFIARSGKNKFLYVVAADSGNGTFKKFDGEAAGGLDSGFKQCPMNHINASVLQELYDFTRPVIIGIDNSFGFGDRLGVANAGHIRALKGSKLRPIFAQQSIRELTRTHREAEEVMDAAVWAVVQEGYKDGFGADADHLKTPDDIDRMAKAGYKFFTFDPGDHVNNDVEDMDHVLIKKKVLDLDWNALSDSSAGLLERYENKKFDIGSGFSIEPDAEEILKAILKYGKAFIHIKKMFDYLKENYSKFGFEVEISVDETYTVTTPFEHFFFVNELTRLGVEFVSLAPRFIGGFEKGIDYKGDIEEFKKEYIKHASIAEHFGNYKLSVHSGSDKFTVYEAIASVGKGHIHVKTAGTSYLEALKVIATHQPELFAEILEYSKGIYEAEKQSYHVSADVNKLKPAKDYKPEELVELFTSDDARQILHVAYGKVLTDKDKNGKYRFREQIYDCLNEHEDTHYEYLIAHFKRHLKPLDQYVTAG